MLPTKSMSEYMNELNRLFPENDMLPELPVFHSMYTPGMYHPTMGNQSSSSDSMSPESFPDMSAYRSPETPVVPRQRPIVGRKIFGQDSPRRTDSPMPRSFEEYSAPIWRQEEVGNASCYELFPNRNIPQMHPQTPIKQSGIQYNSSTRETSLSPSRFSPVSSTLSQSPKTLFSPNSLQFSPQSSISQHSINLSPRPLISMPPRPNYASVTRTSSNQTSIRFPMKISPEQDTIPGQKMCTFCRKNGETPVVYMTHNVRKKIGNRSVVSCPILRSHVCSTCGATGDDAHTITYCPVLRNSNQGLPLQSTTITLKNTRIKSNGRRRY